MIAYIKLLLRVSSSDLDEEIESLIAAAKNDLVLSGVKAESIDESDALIKRAIGIYCKAHFGHEQKDYDRLVEAYNSLKSHLSLSVEYGYVVE